MEELLKMVETTKGIAFENALVVEMKKQGNRYLIEKIVMEWATAKYMIHQNMLQIWKLITTMTFKELSKA
jgi:hypothetical protein